MKWISTKGKGEGVTFRRALLDGIAPDGGLYLPERLDPLDPATLESFRERSLPEIATEVATHLIGGEIPRETLHGLLREALNFEIPVVGVHGAMHALELFHGPTLAFKDVGARVMARLMAEVAGSERPVTVLVATSGDTGSAVAHAFAGVEGTRVVVLYPEGQVSDVQEAQFATIGGNVAAVAVAGTFDDCHALVKRAFSDAALRARVHLTSANSINVGRLIPQSFYYFWAWAQLVRAGITREPVFSVPSGNFGNLTAGLLAKRLGLRVRRFVAATNINDVVPQYLATGTYAPRPSVRTIANAMDIGSPSNFERMRTLYGESLDRLRIDLAGHAYDDRTAVATIREVHDRYGYLLDPHTAIAWLGLRDALATLEPDTPGIFLATAHPAKFGEVVEPAVGRPVPLPPTLAEALQRRREITRVPAAYDAVVRLLTV